MKNIIYRLAACLVAISFFSCEKGLMNFDNKIVDVYFSAAGKNAVSMATDSVYVSFSYTEKLDSVVDVVVAITGVPMDYDRSYKIVLNSASTAIPGVHFEELPKETIIKKNTQSDVLKLKLLRTRDMQEQTYSVVLDLLPNENFDTNFRSRKVGGKPMSTITSKVYYNDIIRKPKKWSDAYFGTFTRKKLFYMCDFLGVTPDYLDVEMTPAEQPAFGTLVQRHLNKEHVAGRTVYEEDGVTPMRMGNSSQ